MEKVRDTYKYYYLMGLIVSLREISNGRFVHEKANLLMLYQGWIDLMEEGRETGPWSNQTVWEYQTRRGKDLLRRAEIFKK